MNAWSKHRYRLLCLLFLAACILSACHRSDVIPTSGGRSYEVLVTGADAAAVNAVAEALRSIPMPGLPQDEPAFDVSVLVKPQLDQGTRYARNIILVSADSTHLQQTRILYEQNVYAHPQTIIHIDAPSVARLQADLPSGIQSISDQLTRAEMSNAIVNLRTHHNKKAEQLIADSFGCRLWVPEDLTKVKQGDHFMWFSNQSARGMQNICIYRFAADSLRRQQLLSVRDSIMRLYITGETDSTFMKTISESVEFRVKSNDGITQLGARGLWEMEGVAMGGPFVSLALLQGDSILCVEGFVYAPEMKKRNLIRRLEASLYTVKCKK